MMKWYKENRWTWYDVIFRRSYRYCCSTWSWRYC